jgi:hypothetical protein
MNSQLAHSSPTPKQLQNVIVIQINKKNKFYISKSNFSKESVMTTLLGIALNKIKSYKTIIKNSQNIKCRGIPQQTNQLLIISLQLLYLWQEKSGAEFSLSSLESRLIHNFKFLEYPLTQKIFLMIFNSKLLKIDKYNPSIRLKAMKSLFLNVLTFLEPNVYLFEMDMQTLLTQIISGDISAHRFIRDFEQKFKREFYNERSISHILQLVRNIWQLSNKSQLGKIHKICQRAVDFENQLNMVNLTKRGNESKEDWSQVRLPLIF